MLGLISGWDQNRNLERTSRVCRSKNGSGPPESPTPDQEPRPDPDAEQNRNKDHESLSSRGRQIRGLGSIPGRTGENPPQGRWHGDKTPHPRTGTAQPYHPAQPQAPA